MRYGNRPTEVCFALCVKKFIILTQITERGGWNLGPRVQEATELTTTLLTATAVGFTLLHMIITALSTVLSTLLPAALQINLSSPRR